MDSQPSAPAPDAITASLRLILGGLRAALGAWRLDAALAVLLYRRIGPITGRIERMLVRFRAGKLRHAACRVATSRHQISRTQAPALPRRFGWLVQAGAHQAAGFGCQLQAVLNAPDMAGLLAASQQARRVLRPLCRALAVELPECPAPPRSADPVPPHQHRTRVLPEPFRIALPRGTLAAARRAGFGGAG